MGVCVCLHPFVECACVTCTSGCILTLHIAIKLFFLWRSLFRYTHRHIASFERTYAEDSFVADAGWIDTSVLSLSVGSEFLLFNRPSWLPLDSEGRKPFSAIPRQCDDSSICILVASC